MEWETCDWCNGSGSSSTTEDGRCAKCHGTGKTVKTPKKDKE